MNCDNEETKATRELHGKVNPVIAREYVEKNYVHKNRIRKLLEEMKKGTTRCHPMAEGTSFAIGILQELLK